MCFSDGKDRKGKESRRNRIEGEGGGSVLNRRGHLHLHQVDVNIPIGAKDKAKTRTNQSVARCRGQRGP